MQGTKDDEVNHRNNTYLVWEIQKCHDEIREKEDPPCESLDNINKWLETKSAFFRALNEKINFNISDQLGIR